MRALSLVSWRCKTLVDGAPNGLRLRLGLKESQKSTAGAVVGTFALLASFFWYQSSGLWGSISLKRRGIKESPSAVIARSTCGATRQCSLNPNHEMKTRCQIRISCVLETPVVNNHRLPLAMTRDWAIIREVS